MRKNILIGFLIIFGTFTYAVAPTTAYPETSYTVVIDSGSTGNRLFIYKIIQNSPTEIPQVIEQTIPNNTNTLPLAGFIDSPSGVNKAIKPLLAEASAYLSKNSIPISNVAVNDLATAGMRIAENTSSDKAAAIYTQVKNTISKAGFKVGRVETISGKEEGLFSWIYVNYANLKAESATNGIIEIGGASAQVVFNTPEATNPNTISIKVGNKTYNVYSVSYLGLGQKVSRNLMNVVASIHGTRDYCYVSGYVNKFDPLFPYSPAFTASKNYNFNSCTENYQNILSMPLYASLHDIGRVNGFSTTSFIGVASLYSKSVDFAGLTPGEKLDRNELSGQLNKICSPANKLPVKESVNCASTTYMYEFLYGAHNSLHLADGQLIIQDTDSALKATWTLGYVVYQAIKE